MGLVKIAREEAYQHPDRVNELLSDEARFRRVAAAAGLEPTQWYWDVLVRLADFDELRSATTEAHGSEHAVLSLTGARRYHDFLAEQIARHPARFSGFAAVPMRDPTRAAGELRRAGRELGFKGALSNGSKKVEDAAHGRYLDEPDHEQFWTAVDELDVPIYLHPRPGLPGTQVASAGHPRLLGATWGFGAETATHVLRLIFSGLFDRHPDVRMVVGHLGEGLPTLL